MKNTRKCSALLAAGAGAAVCLSGGPAHAVNGSFGNSIASGSIVPELGSKVSFYNSSGLFLGAQHLHSTQFAAQGGHLSTYIAGLNCEIGNFVTSALVINPGGPAKYIKIKFNDGMQYYGWSQFQKVGNTFLFGEWSYNNAGSDIPTLADSIVARKLGLPDGRTQLHWTNANEEGVARYEVQAKDASGAWNAVSSEAPGAGMYSIAVPAGTECRVVVEKVDGSTEEIGF